jgi:hypothetical protein
MIKTKTAIIGIIVILISLVNVANASALNNNEVLSVKCTLSGIVPSVSNFNEETDNSVGYQLRYYQPLTFNENVLHELEGGIDSIGIISNTNPDGYYVDEIFISSPGSIYSECFTPNAMGEWVIVLTKIDDINQNNSNNSPEMVTSYVCHQKVYNSTYLTEFSSIALSIAIMIGLTFIVTSYKSH